jgi:hypothetical protein
LRGQDFPAYQSQQESPELMQAFPKGARNF